MANISVIVPVYKVEPYLRRCVDSILAQTYRDFELILVDDGSPDRCGEICEEYAKKDSRITVLHQQNGGLSAARNAGIDWTLANSSSRYLTFVDSDDWIVPVYLECLIEGIGLVGTVSCCGCQELEGDHVEGSVQTVRWRSIPTREYWLQLGYTMTAWGKLYDKSLFVTVRYPVGRVYEDEYVTHRLLFQGEMVAQTSAPLYCYYRRADSITGSFGARNQFDYIPGLEDQYAYFVARQDDALIGMLAKRLMRGYCAALRQVGDSGFRLKLRRLLARHRFPVVRNREAYHLAYPVLFYTMWPVARLLDIFDRYGVSGIVGRIFRRRGVA